MCPPRCCPCGCVGCGCLGLRRGHARRCALVRGAQARTASRAGLFRSGRRGDFQAHRHCARSSHQSRLGSHPCRAAMALRSRWPPRPKIEKSCADRSTSGRHIQRHVGAPAEGQGHRRGDALCLSTSEADSLTFLRRFPAPSCFRHSSVSCRTLSGSDMPDAADRWQNGYISSVSLQNASNNLIRDLLCKQREWSAVSLILNELCANEGVPVDASAVPRSRRGSSRTKGSSSRIAAAPRSDRRVDGQRRLVQKAQRTPPRHPPISRPRGTHRHPPAIRPRLIRPRLIVALKNLSIRRRARPRAPAYSFEETPRRGKLGWIIAAVALLVVSAVAAFS